MSEFLFNCDAWRDIAKEDYAPYCVAEKSLILTSLLTAFILVY